MNFLADLLPSAVVKVITIETTGGLVELETNPHIVEETVPVYKRAELQRTLGSAAGAEFESLMRHMGADLGSTSHSGAELSDLAASWVDPAAADKEATMVTLDVAIKDTLNRNDAAGQWFMSGDITKYLYIFAVQFSSKRAVKAYRSLLAGTSGKGMQVAHDYLKGVLNDDDLKKFGREYGIPGIGNLMKAKKDIKLDLVAVQDIINDIDSSTTGHAVSLI